MGWARIGLRSRLIARVWAGPVVADLMTRFVEAPLLSSGSFSGKLSGQLAGAPQETVQLAAELLYLHLLAPVDIVGPAKRPLSNTLILARLS